MDPDVFNNICNWLNKSFNVANDESEARETTNNKVDVPWNKSSKFTHYDFYDLFQNKYKHEISRYYKMVQKLNLL